MHSKRYTGLILAALVFVGSLAWLSTGIDVGNGGADDPPFFCDEAHKIAESFYYHLFFEQRDLNHPAWTEDFYARINPPVAKYLFGAALTAAGHPVRDHKLQPVFDAMWEQPDELRRHVSDGMLRVTRWTSAFFGAAVCALVFIIARRAAGLAAALIAVVLLLGNPTFTLWAQRGMTDTILWFFLTLIVPVTFAAAAVLRRHWQGPGAGGAARRRSVLFLATVLVPGLVIGLATGTKLNGLLAGPAYSAGLCAAALLCAGAQSIWRRLSLVAVISFLAAGVAVVFFVGINPYFYHDTFRRLPGLLAAWADWMPTMQIRPGGGLFTVQQKITAVGYYALCDSSLFLSQALDIVRLGTLGIWLTILGFCVGLVHLIGRCLPHARVVGESNGAGATEGPGRIAAAITLCWVLVCTAGVALSLSLMCDRHVLPSYLMIGLTTAIGLAFLPRGIAAFIGLILGRSSAQGRLRVVGGFISVTALWIILTFTPWVIASTPEHPRRAWWGPDDSDTAAKSPLDHAHMGTVFLFLGANKEAAERSEIALSLMDREPVEWAWATVLRCHLLYVLSQARMAMGQRDAAIEALRRYVDVSLELRDTMKSDDPCIRGVYNMRIAQSRAEIDRLTLEQSDQPSEGAGVENGKPGHDASRPAASAALVPSSP